MSGLTSYGYLALSSNTTGANNSAFGNYAAYYNTDASCNTAVGSNALFNNTIAPHNTAIGAGSMFYNTTGQLNTAVGSSALEGSGTAAASVGNQNVAIGAQALYDNSGDYNVGVGYRALFLNTDGSSNTAVGHTALYTNIGSFNTATGYQALEANTTGSNNVANGYRALEANTTASSNTSIGSSSLRNNTTGDNNTAIGWSSLANNTIGASNVAIGYCSLFANTANNNTAIGWSSLANNTIGASNVAIGYCSLFSNIIGNSNTAIGFSSLANSTGSNNSAFGSTALQSNTTGGDNIAVGQAALYLNTTGGYNIAIGNYSLDANTTGGYNTSIGIYSLSANTTGEGNTSIGQSSLISNTTGEHNTAIGGNSLAANTLGGQNTSVGRLSGADLSGNSHGNTFLGYQADVSSNTLNYSLSTAIGYQATIDASNQIVLGTATEKVKIPGTYVGIGGVYAPSSIYALDVSGNINFTGDLYKSGTIYPTPTANYWTTNGTDISNNNTGSVGIGCTPNSIYALDVSGALQTTMDATINSLTVGRGGGNVSNNTAVGTNSLYNNTTGSNNTSIGVNSLINNIDGALNISIGNGSLFYNTSGQNNTAIGVNSLNTNTIGGNNIAIGNGAGYDLSGNNNTFLGRSTNVDISSNTYNFSTALGSGAIIDASNQIVLGRSTERVKIPGSYVGIGGKYTPGNGYSLDVSGNTNSYYIDLSSQGNYTGNPWGVVPKKYIDDRVQGLIPLAACQCATTAFVDLSADPSTYGNTIDGYTLQSGNRVLVNYQSGTNPSLTNGIYVVNLTGPTYWTYASDWTGDTYRCTVNVLFGTVNGNTQFIQIQNPGVVTVNPILFQIFASSDQAGRGLSTDFSGNTLYLDVDTTLNFVNYLDNSAGPDNINELNLGTNTNNIYIGKVSGINNKISVTTTSVGINNNNPSSSYVLDVSGNMRTTADALINSITVGRGNGNVSTNTAVGSQALYSNTGNNNTAIGNNSLQNNTTGIYNTALGSESLRFAVSTSNNTAIGFASLYNNTGDSNTSIGFYSLFNNRGTYNTAIGDGSGFDLSGNSNYNTFIGSGAHVDISSNTYNNSTALGSGATIDASNQIVLGTATERVKIPGTYVGIGGVYAPSSIYALDVSGNINFTGDLYKSGTIYPTPTANYWTTDGTDISNNNTGNVGIGCTPSYALDVSGNLNTSMDAYINSITVGLGGGNITTNTAVGEQALLQNNTGSNNTAIGSEALLSNTSGTENTAVGTIALQLNTTGLNNTAVGPSALFQNNTGSNNTGIGSNTLTSITNGSQNTAVGCNAGKDLSGNSTNNTFLGYNTDVDISSNIYNNSTALGFNATIDASNQIVLGTATESVYIPGTYVNIGGTYNPSSGFNLDVSGVLQVQDGTVDSFSTLHGLKVSPSEFFYNSKTPTNTSSFKIELDAANCLIYKGVGPLVGSATVIQNSGTSGGIALASTTTAIYVNESGSVPGVGIMTTNPQYTLDVSGNLNTTMDASINSITVGRGGGNNINNTAFGNQALQTNTTGDNNIALGASALQINTSGSNNVATGVQALQINTSGSDNVATGYQTLSINTTGNSNIALGSGALSYNTTGDSNIALGQNALLSNSIGASNVAIGSNAGQDLSGNSTNNTFLGYNTDVDISSNIYNNSTALGFNATIDASNQIVLGTATESVYIPGSYVNIGGAYNPGNGPALDVSGNLFISQASFGNLYQNQIGYTLSTTAATTFGPLNFGIPTNLASVTIPKGVWIVEGSLTADITGTSSYAFGLSASTSYDPYREVGRYIPTGSATWADHITSVFVLSSPTTIYLLGNTGVGGSTLSNSNVITYTKIG